MEAKDAMNLYWFTFGLAHPLSKMVQGVRATNESRAREVMFEFYGNKFAFSYSGKDGEENEKELDLFGYKYTPIPKVLKEGDLLQ